MWWGGVALLVLALMVGQAFAANLSPELEAGTTAAHGVAYAIDRSNVASRVTSGSGATLVLDQAQHVASVAVKGSKTTNGTLAVMVALKDTRGGTLATGQAALPERSGDFSVTINLEPATIPYSRVATVSVVYGR